MQIKHFNKNVNEREGEVYEKLIDPSETFDIMVSRERFNVILYWRCGFYEYILLFWLVFFTTNTTCYKKRYKKYIVKYLDWITQLTF